MEITLLFGKLEVAVLDDVWGFNLLDRYCYTSYFGWEKRKEIKSLSLNV